MTQEGSSEANRELFSRERAKLCMRKERHDAEEKVIMQIIA